MVRRSIARAFLFLVLCGHGIGAQYNNCTSWIVDEIRDGLCDSENNNEGCAYDGGDCCPCTTIKTWDSDDDDYPLFCLDPNSGCVDPLVDIYPNCTSENYIEYIGDGRCDVENNKKECGYDGGDCCECTRTDNGSSSSSLLCVDPFSACYNPAAVALSLACTDGDIPTIGNGWCDFENNNEACLYDGGDCCPCTTNRTRADDDGGYTFCLDPNSGCVDPLVDIYPNCTSGIRIEDIGNGYCGVENNNKECG